MCYDADSLQDIGKTIHTPHYLHKLGEIINNLISSDCFNDDIGTPQNPICDVWSFFII